MSNVDQVRRDFENAVYVSNDLELKTEMGKHTPRIISADIKLYEKMIQTFPKAKIAKKSKKGGKVLMWLGIGITVATGGVLSIVGLPIAGAGAVLGVSGIALDDYKHYKIYIDYDEKRLLFRRKRK